MRKTVFILLSIFSPLWVLSQNSLDELLDRYNNETIPYISVSELSKIQDQVILLDAREIDEYQTSHLKGAIHVGYDHFTLSTLDSQTFNKETKIVVYCSLGIRSEDISEKLKKAGYQNVFNLYGGIFEWKNNDFEVVDSKGKETDKVHAFSKEWGKWLHNGQKIYKQ